MPNARVGPSKRPRGGSLPTSATTRRNRLATGLQRYRGPSPVGGLFPLRPELGIGAGDEAADQALRSFEEAGAVQQRVPEPGGDAIVSIVGALVVNVVVLFGEDHTPLLQPPYERRRGIHVRPLVELVGQEGGEAQEDEQDSENVPVVG